MISRRHFLALLSGVPLVGDILTPHNRSGDAWAQFASDLADTLADLGEDEFLISVVKKNWHYVQFAGQGNSGMRVEARSNAYTDATDRLSEQACAQLLSLGWKAPTYVPDRCRAESNEPAGSPNYFMDIGVPVPYHSVARLAAETLRGPFAASDPGELQYKAFSNGEGAIRFPNLRIPRTW